MELVQAHRAAGIGVVAASEHVGPPRLHRALPALSTRLVISLGTPIEVHYDGRVHRSQAVVAGLMRPGIASPVLVLSRQQPTVYAELTPSAMQRLTGVPPSEVDAGGTGAETLLPWLDRLSEELADHPAKQREWLMRVRLLERLRLADRIDASADAFEALRVIRASHGRASVAELARYVHLSPRHLRHVMRRTLGIGPKFASRVARLSAAVGRAGEGADSWAQVAAETAYHDHSHLVHDFNALMRTTPTAWLAEESRNLQGRRRSSA